MRSVRWQPFLLLAMSTMRASTANFELDASSVVPDVASAPKLAEGLAPTLAKRQILSQPTSTLGKRTLTTASCQDACSKTDTDCIRACSRLVRRQQNGLGLRRGNPADVENDPQARAQDQQDAAANQAAEQGATIQAVGGIGGVDPATGQELLALPPPSQFCQQSGQSLADGTQQRTGFCSSLPQGQIPTVDKMVSSLITSPENGAQIPAGQPFTVSVQTNNLETGFFTVAASEYYTQPQTLNNQGIVQGHQHVTIQRLTSLTQAPDANEKDFFKGLNDAANGDGTLSVEVPGLNTPGRYRICCMSGTFSHQPTVMPIAQRGAQDDCIRVDVVNGNGGNNAGGGSNGGANGGAGGNGNAWNVGGNVNAGNGRGNGNVGNGRGNGNVGNGRGNGNAGNVGGNRNAGNGRGNGNIRNGGGRGNANRSGGAVRGNNRNANAGRGRGRNIRAGGANARRRGGPVRNSSRRFG